MEKFSIYFAIGGTVMTMLVGQWHVSLTILVAFMVIDYLTGIIKGAINGGLRSAIGFKGVLRKSTIMLVIILAHMLDLLVNDNTPIFRTMAVFFYVGNEGISIIENLGLIGVPVPTKLKQYIQQLSNEETEIPVSKGNTK